MKRSDVIRLYEKEKDTFAKQEGVKIISERGEETDREKETEKERLKQREISKMNLAKKGIH